MNTTELLFLLLRSEICGNKNEVITESLSENDLKSLFRLAKAHDISHIVSSALEKRGLFSNDEVSRRFQREQMISVYRSEQLKYAFNEICALFENEKIPYIPLKGSVLRSYYPEEWMRTSCDIDILIRDEDIKRAADALTQRLDYQTDYRRNYHDTSLHSPNGVHLELHFNIKENMRNIDTLLSEVWEHSRREKSDAFRYELTKEFFVFHHVAHMSYHFINGGCGVRPFIDLFIMKNNIGYDERTVRDYCRQCDIEDFYNNLLNLTDVWFDGDEHTPLTQRIEDYILQGGLYGTLENKVIVSQSKRGGKLKYVLSRFFMPYEALKNYYPVLNKHKWLFPFMQIRRWIRFLLKGKFKKGIREIRVNQRVEKSQTEKMRDFLKEVGL